MKINLEERYLEEKYLKKTLIQVKKNLNEQQNYYNKFKKELIAIQRQMREDIGTFEFNPWDIDEAIEVLHYEKTIEREAIRYKSSKEQIDKLKKIALSPYFGRIDFQESVEDTKDIYYIGIGNIVDEKTDDFLVIDWRAPVASMFYDCEVGKSNYKSPRALIEGELLLKRQIKIHKGQLKYVIDSNLKINDDLLQEILSDTTDSKMNSIVTSIQKEQNEVIRDKNHRLLIVQGPAGSGKTSIALHRIAFLLYNYQKTIKAKNIIIFSPNAIFNDYISDVLPELGEENMKQITFIDFAEKFIGNNIELEVMSEQMDTFLSSTDPNYYSDRTFSIQYKSSSKFIDLLDMYVNYLENNYIHFEDIYYKQNLIISKHKLYNLLHKEYTYLPLFQRLEKIKNRVFYLIKPYEKERLEEIINMLLNSDVSLTEKGVKVEALNLVKREFEPLKDRLTEKTSLDLIVLYTHLFENKKLLEEINTDLSQDNITNLRKTTLEGLKKDKIHYEDVAPLVYLKLKLNRTSESLDIRHVVIDEAQDYTPLHYKIFKQLFLYSNFTLLGDLNQSINPFMNIGQYEQIASILQQDVSFTTALLTLTKTYRSTSEISNFTKALLLQDIHYDHLERHGLKPQIIQVTKENIHNKLINDIKILQSEGFKSIAILCKTINESLNAFNAIKKNISVHIINHDTIKYPEGIVVIPSYLAKGLEFDAVLIYDGSAKNYCIERDRKLFYTVCTRALHRLYIYFEDNLSSFILDIDQDLYEVEKNTKI
ncbi:HelD family protein [Senegalia massiliensis]|uniref:HelD family protein n=1 Tax=Senegalia massiliensis TaxID=1720316 RepID=UPI0010314926|nr:UvrD-helicase domain-containing protein [Senegalia massiliensis]